MGKRKALSRKTRFEVFKRDSFTCQYCGAKAPEVLLQVDHIQPASKGGRNNPLNLVTSCKDCNAGKGARELDDNTTIEKQRQQLTELQERREQLDMLFSWQRGLIDIEDDTVSRLSDYWKTLCPPFSLTESGTRLLKKWVRKYGVNDVMGAMRTSTEQYLEYEKVGDSEQAKRDSAEKSFSYIPKICSFNRVVKEKPYMKDILYIRGILRNRVNYCNDWEAKKLLLDAYRAGVDVDFLKGITKSADNWNSWRADIEELTEKAEQGVRCG